VSSFRALNVLAAMAALEFVGQFAPASFMVNTGHRVFPSGRTSVVETAMTVLAGVGIIAVACCCSPSLCAGVASGGHCGILAPRLVSRPAAGRAPGVLRLRGAGGELLCKGDNAACGSSLDLQLTRKMEEVWQHADALRRMRWTAHSAGAGACASATGHPLMDGDDGSPSLPGDTESMRIFEILQHHLQDHSALLRHEVCYAMGQTGLRQACPVLIAVLRNARS